MRSILRLAWPAVFLLWAACGSTDSSGPTPTPAISVSVSPGSVTVTAGSTGQANITVGRSGGYGGSIALSLEGAPAGVSGTFNPASVPGSSTASVLTLDVGGSVAAGNYSLTVRASGSGVTSVTSGLTLTVNPAPTYSLSVTPTSVNVQQGATAQATVNLTRVGGFAGTVTLSLEGAPAGLTGSFNPAGATGASSVLTLTASGTAAAGTYALTVRGTATGQSDKTTALSVTVLPGATGSFTLSLAPATLSITQGQNAQSTVNITRTGGFTGAVTMALEGAPAGVTGTFSPNPAAANSSVLTVAVGAGAAPGNYSLTVRGSTPSPSAGDAREAAAPELATDQTVTLALTVTAAPGYSLAAETAFVSQGQSGTASITLTRTGGFSGSVTLALEGAPAGVTGAFAPNPATGTGSTVTLTVAGTVAVGVYDLTVRGTATGLADQTAPLKLTVFAAGNYSLTASPNVLATSPGGSSNTTIGINRTGGFAGSVALTYTTNAPAGVTITFTPSSTTGTSATMGVTVGGGVAVGSYTITVKGNTAGLPERTTTVTLNVQSAGSGSVSWTFCDQSGIPVWVAYQNGASGPWTQATGAANTYNFNITDPKGAVAWVKTSGAKAELSITYGSVAELQNNSPSCKGNGSTMTVNATMANLAVGQTAAVTLGGATATVLVPTQANFAITGVGDGTTDLVAVNYTQSFLPPFFNRTVNGVIIRRLIDPVPNSTLPGTLDWNGPEKFGLVEKTATVTNGSGTLQSVVTYMTATGTSALLGTFAMSGSPYTFGAVPDANRQAGDLHILTVTTALTNPYAYRAVSRIFGAAADQSVTFGAPAPAGSFTTATTIPYLRPRIEFTNEADYNRLILMYWANTGGNQSSANVLIWEGFGLGLNVDYTLPDFSAVAGWNNAWGLQSGVGNVSAGFNVTGWTAGGGIGMPPQADGTTSITAGRRVDNISP